MKHTQKVDHFRAYLALVATCKSSHQIRLAGWTKEVASGMLKLGGWWGMEWLAKVKVQNGGSASAKLKNQLGRAALAS